MEKNRMQKAAQLMSNKADGRTSRARAVGSAQPTEDQRRRAGRGREARPREGAEYATGGRGGRASQGVRGRIGVFWFWVRPGTTAAQTMAIVSMPLKGMSVAAACEKAIMPTVVGNSSRSHRAVSAP